MSAKMSCRLVNQTPGFIHALYLLAMMNMSVQLQTSRPRLSVLLSVTMVTLITKMTSSAAAEAGTVYTKHACVDPSSLPSTSGEREQFTYHLLSHSPRSYGVHLLVLD